MCHRPTSVPIINSFAWARVKSKMDIFFFFFFCFFGGRRFICTLGVVMEIAMRQTKVLRSSGEIERGSCFVYECLCANSSFILEPELVSTLSLFGVERHNRTPHHRVYEFKEKEIFLTKATNFWYYYYLAVSSGSPKSLERHEKNKNIYANE